jgi:methylmalonyl-CoA carboxyltransferase 12S subunit
MEKPTELALEAEVKELRERVAKLESLLAAYAAKAKEEAQAPPATKHEGITPELILAISAAVAAFLGKRAKIHQIRLTGKTAWAEQGRATMQASHSQVLWHP